MKLAEISNDELISVTISRGNTSASLVTEPAFVLGGDLYVKPFTYNNAIVSFDAPGLTISMMAFRDDAVPYFWKYVQIVKLIKDGEVYHCISSSMDGVKLNRRNAYRVFVGEDGECFVTTNKSVSVTIRDISANGIGLMVYEEDASKFSFGMKIRISFSDSPMYFNADLMARVVRVIKSEKGCVIGCEFTAMYPEVSKYVAAKQLKLKKAAQNKQ